MNQFNGFREKGFDLIGEFLLKGKNELMNVYRISPEGLH
jgi:hypothetical protein